MTKPVGVGAVSQRLIVKGERIWIADAHRGDGKRFVVRAEDKLTAFLELQRRFELATNSLGKVARFFPNSPDMKSSIQPSGDAGTI